MILKTGSIRDVIAFPKNRRAFCPLTEAPSSADPAQLEELALNAPSNMVEGDSAKSVRGATEEGTT